MSCPGSMARQAPIYTMLRCVVVSRFGPSSTPQTCYRAQSRASGNTTPKRCLHRVLHYSRYPNNTTGPWITSTTHLSTSAKYFPRIMYYRPTPTSNDVSRAQFSCFRLPCVCVCNVLGKVSNFLSRKFIRDLTKLLVRTQKLKNHKIYISCLNDT